MLDVIDDGIWCARGPLKLVGLPFGSRMTIVRLPDGGLWVHSPVKWTEELNAAVAAVGKISVIVAPNVMHHLFVDRWAEAWPDARVVLAPGLPKKRNDLRHDAVLSAEPDASWKGTIEQTTVDGVPGLRETVFYVPSSRTLIVTDLMFNVGELPGLWGATYKALMLGKERPAVPRLVRMITKDKAALRASVERIAAWDFQRVIVTHGDVAENFGPDDLRERFGWL